MRVDLMLVVTENNDRRLAYARELSGLMPGDRVICQTRFGEREASVKSVLEFVEKDSDMFRFALALNTSEVWRVIASVVRAKIDTEEMEIEYEQV